MNTTLWLKPGGPYTKLTNQNACYTFMYTKLDTNIILHTPFNGNYTDIMFPEFQVYSSNDMELVGK